MTETEKQKCRLQADLDLEYEYARAWLLRDPDQHKRHLAGITVAAQLPPDEFKELIASLRDDETGLLQRVLSIGATEIVAKVWPDDAV